MKRNKEKSLNTRKRTRLEEKENNQLENMDTID